MSKRCYKCGLVKAASAFYKCSRNNDGLRPECIECGRKAEAEYQQTARGHKSNRERSQRYRERRPLRVAAVQAVRNAVRAGGLPDPRTLSCAGCGKQAEQYHHNSYGLKHQLDVLPLCRQCHEIKHHNCD